MNLSHLYYFRELALRKNRRETAEALNISQPTLSQAISKLESELGVGLVAKNRSGVVLTEEGEAFSHYVESSLSYLDSGIDFVRKRNADKPRVINVGAVFSAQNKDWSRILYEFRRRTGGDTQINVIQSTTPDILLKLRNGKVDVAFAGPDNAEMSINDAEMRFHPCWKQQATLVVNRLHPFANQDCLSLDSLEGQHIVSYALDGPLGPSVTNLLKGHENLYVETLYSDEITLASIVLANPDIIAIACRSWLLDAYQDELKCIDIAEAPDCFRQIYICYRLHQNHSPIIKAFLKVAMNQWN